MIFSFQFQSSLVKIFVLVGTSSFWLAAILVASGQLIYQ
jgi:hypothetical protein